MCYNYLPQGLTNLKPKVGGWVGNNKGGGFRVLYLDRRHQIRTSDALKQKYCPLTHRHQHCGDLASYVVGGSYCF